MSNELKVQITMSTKFELDRWFKTRKMAIFCNVHFRKKHVDIWLFDPVKRLGYGRSTSDKFGLDSPPRTRVMVISVFSLDKQVS